MVAFSGIGLLRPLPRRSIKSFLPINWISSIYPALRKLAQRRRAACAKIQNESELCKIISKLTSARSFYARMKIQRNRIRVAAAVAAVEAEAATVVAAEVGLADAVETVVLNGM